VEKAHRNLRQDSNKLLNSEIGFVFKYNTLHFGGEVMYYIYIHKMEKFKKRMSSNFIYPRQDSSKIVGATHSTYLLSVNDENFLLESVTHCQSVGFVFILIQDYGLVGCDAV
jgi:hypothetical protein